MKAPLSLSIKLWRWLLLVALLPMLILATLVQWHMEQRLVEQQQAHLYNLAREKSRLISEVSLATKSYLESLAERTVFADLLVNEHNPRAQLEAMQLSQALLNRQSYYHDVILVNRSGQVVYTLKQESDLGVNLREDTWIDTGAGLAFDQSRRLLTTVVTPVRYYEPSSRSASFMATPVWSPQGRWLGVLMVQLNQEWLAEVAQSGVGTTRTGEVVLSQLNGSGKLEVVAPLRFDRKAAIRGRLLDESHEVPANLAIKGDEGWGIGVDYRHERVLAGWVYVPSMQLALVVKQDESEVLSSLHTMRLYTLALLLVVILLVSLLSIAISQRLTRPLLAIIDTLQQLKSGRWHLRVADEQLESEEAAHLVSGINQLADTIEEQLERLQHQTTELEYQAQTLAQYNQDLEEAVRERTKELAQLSLIDPMTGLFNRRHYIEEGVRLWKTVARQRQCLMFALLDVDHFKLFNDSRGHQMGDEALTLVAQCLQQTCQRSSDLAFRMGGEEMAALVVVKDVDDAMELAERLRVAVESKAMMHPRSPIKGILTVSIGVALLDARACQHASEANLDGLYRLADEALYRAKHQGRNQVVLAREILGC
ncbi:MAG: sensor domain-containing diguanylate cyclase [Gammaproteobacteria bacterium]|nr:sensor domain-containing diguanylate cyclase [Gammaproteobacteria bacterium]HQR95656.1 sensor domain-containing diguanylate cyclase [Thiotrichales bacterium]